MHGLFKLGQQGFSDADRRWLGFDEAGTNNQRWSGQAAGFAFADSAPLPGDTGYVLVAGQVAGFLGDLDNRQALAELLDLPIDCPAAQLVASALARQGEPGLNLVEGQWTFWLWDTQERQLTVAVSRNLRDTVYLAFADGCAALSSSIRHLQALPWLREAMDELGLLVSFGRAPLRAGLRGRTWQRDVKALLPGSVQSVRLEGQTQAIWASPLQAERWQGSFEDAVREMERRARRAVRHRIRRHKTIAILLSGGMDSSVLAWLAATELRPDQRLFAVSSVASSGSGMPDERDWIALVAHTLGIEVHYVSPDSDADVYRPSRTHFDRVESPMLSARHYLYEKLFSAAQAAGADAVLDGCFGEQSLTRSCASKVSVSSWRRMASRLLQHARRTLGRWNGRDVADLFHVRVSAQARALLPDSVTRKLPPSGLSVRTRPQRLPMGLPQGYEKAAFNSESTSIDGLRRLLPFRAPELLTFSAALPGKYAEWNGQSRAIVRAILSQRFPPELCRRTDKKPFCPEHLALLQRCAAAELLRIDSEGASLAWDWIDRPWLRKALHQVAVGQADARTRDMVQASCVALAFLKWQQT